MTSDILPIPAVDLAGGRVVRLLRGVRRDETVYGADPMAFAAGFAEEGAEWIHVVDLDGAFGDGENREATERIVRESGLRVQVAGGARALDDFRRWRDAGAGRVVFGTAAIENPEVVEAAIREDREGVAVALDVRDGRLRARGWVADGGDPEPLARRYADAAAFIHTGIDRDGAMAGPDLAGALAVALATGVPTIIAGGIGSAAHLTAIREAAARTRAPISGVILGRALYEKRLTLTAAREALQGPGSAAEAPRRSAPPAARAPRTEPAGGTGGRRPR